jgi:hypothetical protein
MPRRRVLEAYPNRQFLALVTHVRATGQPFLVPCTPSQAAGMRGELYAWRRACEDNPTGASVIGVDVSLLRDVAWKVDPAGLLTIPEAKRAVPALIEAALGAPAPALPSAQAAASASLERLRAMGLLGIEQPKEQS